MRRRKAQDAGQIHVRLFVQLPDVLVKKIRITSASIGGKIRNPHSRCRQAERSPRDAQLKRCGENRLCARLRFLRSCGSWQTIEPLDSDPGLPENPRRLFLRLTQRTGLDSRVAI